MRRAAIFIAVIALGFCAGLGLRSYFEPKPSKVTTAIGLFREFCLSIARSQDFVPTSDLVRLNTLPSEVRYGHSTSQLTIQLRQNSCVIDSVLAPFSDDEQLELAEIIDALVVLEFPMLEHDDNTGMNGPKNRFWFQYPAFDDRRWGISLLSFDYLEPPQTVLSYYYPK
ncbi:MAG: hypothetical protein OXC60_02840 [Litoreibacter sp.]|nr:hypothetical protein [Litoreibacter sp.]MCY4333591.1 hypothetical protein [Litoreibacter sp.]